jgi:hypothetical protein
MMIKEEHPMLETVDVEVYAGSPFDLNEISSWNIISELLKGTISKKDVIIEVDNLSNCAKTGFDTMGAARFEILHYQKTSLDENEQITFYGIAENIKFQTKPFILNCDTFWTDERFAHNSPNGQYFDSIIVNQYGKSPIIEDITFNLILRDSHEVIIGHCSGSLRFDAEHLS